MMNNEREILARHLRELLQIVEDPESDWSKLRYWFHYWRWKSPTEDEILLRLRRIEKHLESINAGRCAFAEGDRADHVIKLITGIEGKQHEERKHLTSWLSGALHLTVVDPYFFSFSGPNKVYRTEAQYLESIVDLIPTTLQTIEVYHLPGPNKKIFNPFQKHCRKKNIALRNWATTEIHDRVLIKNNSEAKVLGTSFGGLGNKIAFVLDLPEEDLKVFRSELRRINQKV